MNARLLAELELLRGHYDAVEFYENGNWFLVGKYNAPRPWTPNRIDVVFSVTTGYPGAQPYGFFVPASMRHNGRPPTAGSAKATPPFEGDWIFLSWQPNNWRPTADIQTGSNLWGWCRGFQARLAEGP